jgi:hypothetical protein
LQAAGVIAGKIVDIDRDPMADVGSGRASQTMKLEVRSDLERALG